MKKLSLAPIHPSWLPVVKSALAKMSPEYISHLEQTEWLPGPEKIFNAFSLPLAQVKYVLLGESPYPRAQSANGYAFWDNAVKELWSPQGLSKTVNRATSLRNFIKMLLVTDHYLAPTDMSQGAIAALDKTGLVQTAADLFENMQKQGILLLNASLVLSQQPVKLDAAAWQPFMLEMFTQLHQHYPKIQFILLGKIAAIILRLCPFLEPQSFVAEHPYNLSFITNSEVQQFFKAFYLLRL